MKKILLHATISFIVLLCMQLDTTFAQGVTTASINGSVEDEAGEPMPGATVVAIHGPSGTKYGTITRDDGRYNLPNVRVGGPYTLTASFVGFKEAIESNVQLGLGQNQRIKFTLYESTVNIDAVQIIGERSDVLNSGRTGAETTVSQDDIQNMPTINRDIFDYARTTPQATITADGGFSVAGVNNRYNAIFIDGAVNNDVFGLAASGTNGGQTGISPISIDALEQIQIVVAPYDVTLGGFAGGGINAVTRSGSNTFEGSAYWLFKNQDFTGKTHPYIFDPDKTLDKDSLKDLREKVSDFTSNLYGVRLGGPIKKDKIFFFVNAEIQRDETPQPFEFTTYDGDASRSEVDALISKLDELGYDPGGFENNTQELKGLKLLGRLDFNLSDDHKLTLRHSYTKGEQINPSSSDNRTINFYNTGILFPSVTNSSAAELKSTFGNKYSNDLTLGFTAVRDDRDPIGQDFPWVNITDGSGEINFGSEEFSTANLLEQNIFTITNNFKIYEGDHTITLGTHNEFYDINNVFIRQNYGSYIYDSLDQFLNDLPATEFNRSYSLVDGVTGDETGAAAAFQAMQLGFYVQDKYQVNEKFNLTAGLRVDIPFFLSDPVSDQNFNDSTIAMIESFNDGSPGGAVYDLLGTMSGQMPKTALMFSPRIGFNWDVIGDRTTQIRGGIGIFTSRVPFVWPGGAYNNNGQTVGGTFQTDVNFEPDPFNQPFQPDLNNVEPSGQIDLFSENFKYPQVFRTSLAVDQQLPWGLIGTLEGIYTKTLNNVTYYNLNLKPSTRSLTGTPDNRPIYDRRDEVDDTYTRILLADNTNKGFTYNITAQLEKTFEKGFTASVAYTFGRAQAIFEGTSSQNSSQWRGVHSVSGRNYAPLGRSDFDQGSRVIAFVSYGKEYAKYLKTSVSLFYNGQSGSPYSYIYNDNGALNNEDSRERNLIYIPANQSDILFDEFDDDGNPTLSQAEKDEMWKELDQFIRNDNYLSEHRGEYAEKNMSRTPFEHIVDLRIAQDFFVMQGGNKHDIQITLDILNFTNLINPRWGRQFFNPGFGNYELLDFEGFYADGTTPAFTFNNPGENFIGLDDFASRWRMQLGVRYSFN